MNKRTTVNIDSFFKIRASRNDYLGERYFRYNKDADKVVQVCCNPGDMKKGKSNTIGVYLIARMTFMGNYLGPNYVEPCSKNEYMKKIQEVIKILQS